MSRKATISLENQTGCDLTYLSEQTQHGKFDGPRPPQSIANGATGSFKVTSDFGHPGPQGSVTYSLTTPGGAKVTLTFSWNHPDSKSTSSYEMGSEPPWYGSYSVVPSPPEGTDQKITIVARLNPVSFDPRSWMSLMGGGSVLRDMFLPGSHDSGSYDIGFTSAITLDYESGWVVVASYADRAQGWARSQSGSVLDQLNAGIRYLDLRLSNGYFVGLIDPGGPITLVGPNEPPPFGFNVAVVKPRICHSLSSVDPAVVLEDIQLFLDAHSREVLLVNFEHFYNMQESDYSELIGQITQRFGDRMVPRSLAASIPSLTLDQLWQAGQQIIVFFGSDHIVKISGHPDDNFIPFEQRYPDLYAQYPAIWSENQFLNRPWARSTTLVDLQSELQGFVNDQGTDRTRFFVLQGVISPDTRMYENAATGEFPDSLRQLGETVSPSVLSWVNNLWRQTGVNVIELDWAESSPVTQLCRTVDWNR